LTTLDGIRDIKILQNREGYRFSVDPLLLYSFVNVKYAREIVDLGAGSGIIGLLLARKYPDASVSLVELQESLFCLAQENTKLNDLDKRVSVVLSDINEIEGKLGPRSCDIAVSNPPFRKPATGRLSRGDERAVARHEIKLALPGLVRAASYLLRAKGRFFTIFHPERILELVDVLRLYRLEPKRIRFVHNDVGSVSKIVLVESVKEGSPGLKIEKPLVIYERDGSYTDELKKLYEA
jgi:tRNA1Val (adenine37-N6)-methyltransferase